MGSIIKAITFIGLIAGLGFNMFIKYGWLNGAYPEGEAQLVTVTNARCALRGGPGTKFAKVGSARTYARAKTLFIIFDERGAWLNIIKNETSAWIHRKCTSYQKDSSS